MLLGPHSTVDVVALQPYREVVDVVTAPADVLDGTALVRPDGYVAAVGTAGDLAPILGYLRDLVGRAPDSALTAVPAIAGLVDPRHPTVTETLCTT